MRAILLLTLVTAMPLAGCYDWKATDHPVSGIKISDPSAAEDTAGKDYILSGSIVANGTGSLQYDFRYKPNPWEAFSADEYLIFRASDTIQISDPKTITYSDALSLPSNTLPGRYYFYSLVRDVNGNVSDTNRTYRRIVAPRLFPTLTATNYVLPSATVPEVVRTATSGQSILTIASAQDTSGLDSVVFYRELLLDEGQFQSTKVGKILLGGRHVSATDSGIFPIPATAVRTQRYRLETRYYNILGHTTSWKPLFQVR